MNFPGNILLLLSCLAIALALASPSASLGERKLLQAMRSTSELQVADPSRSMECFQYYSEIFDQLLKQYQADYAGCKNISDSRTLSLDDKYKDVVNSLNETTSNACQRIINCYDDPSNLDALSCYSSVGENNVRVMYNISSTANTNYAQLQQAIQAIQFNEELCTNTSQRTYELNTDQAYINLQNCLLGTEPIPTTSTTKTTTSVITKTTKATKKPPKTTKAPTTKSQKGIELTTESALRSTPSLVTLPFVSNASASTTSSTLSAELKKFLNSLT